jgi:single-strand DNA-binding protein
VSEGLNKVMLIGNLGADPELKYTQGGQAICKLRLATTERYKSKDGERQERTEWHSVIIWGNRAEALGKILEKGKTVYIEGRLQTSSWDDKEGNKRYKTEINATEILLLGGKGGGERQQSEPRQSSGGGASKHSERQAPKGDAAQDDGPDFGDDNIPF